MLAARASMPENISEGSVMNEPPPASAFCAPAHMAAKKRTMVASMALSDLLSERARGLRMRGHQAREVDADRRSVDDAPLAVHHDAVGAMRAAQDERGQRIMRAGKTRLVERVKRQIGAAA